MLLLLALLAIRPVMAGDVSVTVTSPGIEIVVDPFSPSYAPAPRPGYVWVAGFYDPYGFWVPGYWAPVQPRVGYVWVPGYWVGRSYHDGYWRTPYRGRDVWVDGYYVNGRYVAPRWVSPQQVDAYRRQQAHEREEARNRAHGHQRPDDHGHERKR